MAADRPEVLTSLPRSRPTRRSAKRGSTNDGEAAAEKPKAKKAAAAKKPAAKPKAAAPKTKTKAKAKAPAKAKPAAKARPKPKAKPAPARRAALKEVPGGEKPQPVSAGAPDLEDFPKGPPSGPVDPPSGGELLESAVKAAGEIAQAGVTVGREALKSITRRLPRP
jgi:membrane protein involved in colicin uptake